MATIKIQKNNESPRVLPNCTFVNGKIVGIVGGGKYQPYWNGARLAAAGKTNEARSLRQLTDKNIGEWSQFLFEIGDNGDGYVVSVYTPEKQKMPSKRGYSTIFGASDDFGR